MCASIVCCLEPIVDENSVEPTKEGPASQQPTRAAASQAVDQMRRWINYLMVMARDRLTNPGQRGQCVND